VTASGAGLWRLDGRTALVTGGTRGIGRAVVDQLVDRGAHVLSIARAHSDPASASVTPVVADLESADGRARIVDAARGRGALHVLVHNAATNIRKPLVEYDDATLERLIAFDLTAPLLLSRDLHPFLRAAHGASVVHVGSVAGLVALPTGVAYAAAKAGLAQAARTLALEWAKDAIRVNTVAPWYTRTPLAEPVLSDPARLSAILARTPLARIAEPSEVAAAITFLALPASSYITGHCLTVDGGMSIQGLAAP
jgi:Tropinone reductase 1